MRCPYCGNENPEGNRFCGMCGGTLLAEKVPAAKTQQAAASGHSTVSASGTTVRSRTPDSPRTVPPTSDTPASISGPSFLGLSDPAPVREPESRQTRKHGSLSIAPDSSASSHNLDYLLEDDEPKGGGAGKVFLILIALALALGLGYLRWKNHSFGWLSAIANKPAAAQTNSSPSGSDSSAPAPSNITPEAQPPVAAQPAAGQPAAKSDAPASATSANGGGTSAPSAPTDAAPNAGKSDSANNPATTPAPDGAATNPQPTTTSAADTSAKAPATTSSSGKQPAAAADDKSADQPDTSSDHAAAKPHAASKPVPRMDPVAEAQKYLYGRGAAQDCDRGLRLLKPAADKADSKAMIEMGALYSAGLCTPHDLPTAYRWFALALRKDPANQAVQTDLQKLWGEMTQPERQLAIKLTQ